MSFGLNLRTPETIFLFAHRFAFLPSPLLPYAIYSCLQLWHMGRQSHSSHQPGGQQIVSASAIACPGDVTTASGEKSPYEVPRPLETEEIAGVVQDYKKAAQFCKDAGFDFVEIHGANGYLIDQFLQSCTNKRTDRYGGSFENRFRILDEVVTAIKEVYPSEAIGVRLAPNGGFAGMGSEDNAAAFVYYAAELAKHNLGFLHVMDGVGFGQHSFKLLTLSDIRKVYDGVIMANVGYTKETADGVIRSGAADMVRTSTSCATSSLLLYSPRADFFFSLFPF